MSRGVSRTVEGARRAFEEEEAVSGSDRSNGDCWEGRRLEAKAVIE